MQAAKADCECPIYITYTNVNGYLILNLTYKSGEQMEQLGKYGFLRRDYLKTIEIVLFVFVNMGIILIRMYLRKSM